MALLCGLIASACDDPPPQPQQPPQDEPAAHATAGQQKRAWLGIKDDTAPWDWLSQRAAGNGHPLSDEQLGQLRQRLQDAAKLFGETPRMIANRAAQIEDLLKEIDIDERADELMGTLLSTVGTHNRTGGFGALGQHYVNLRRSGLSQQAALDDLTGRYGPASE